MSLTFKIQGTEDTITLDAFHAVVAGYTGRDAAAVQHHIYELAAIGVAPPPDVPMFYVVDPATVNSDAGYTDSANLTSGEIEPVYIRHAGAYYLGVGSDHTDRDLEREDIGDSKRACPKPVGRTVVRIEDIGAFSLDDSIARSTVDGLLYQEGTLDGLRTPSNVTERLVDRLGLADEDDFVCLGGTLPLLDGGFRPGTAWHVEIELADGTRLTHDYQMEGRK